MSGTRARTVFEPEIGYHRIPIVVKDYNSLYPSSIIAYNMSHETIVFDVNYDNLEDYTYMEITFKNMDGSKTTCRYSKHKNGELGILPAILDKLIKERKSTRKQMESEADPFKRTILDGKQLALKVDRQLVVWAARRGDESHLHEGAGGVYDCRGSADAGNRARLCPRQVCRDPRRPSTHATIRRWAICWMKS